MFNDFDLSFHASSLFISEHIKGIKIVRPKDRCGISIVAAMSSDILPPNPCLVAILLVVRVNSEPRIVFHYPPRPGKDNTHITRYLAAQEKDKDGSSSTDDDSSSSQDEIVVDNDKTKESKTGDNTPELDVEEPGSVSPEKNDMWQSQYGKTKWSDLFGFPAEALAKLFCPPSTSHKQRFEMSIDDKVFVGRPIFAREGDQWQKKKAERKAKAKKAAANDEIANMAGKETADQPTQEAEDSTDASERGHSLRESDQIYKQTSPGPRSRTVAGPHVEAKPSKSADREILNMFHVVFVLNPPPLEYQLRVKEMYDQIIKKFSKALKREQARSSYVLREASLLYKEAPLMKKALGKIHLGPISTYSTDWLKPRINHWQLFTTDINHDLLWPKQ